MEDQVQYNIFGSQFLTWIDIRNILDIGELSIALGKNEINHLIITGRNGSGKTTVINKLKKFISGISEQATRYLDKAANLHDPKNLEQLKIDYINDIVEQHGLFASFFEDPFKTLFSKYFIFTSFEAKRTSSFKKPTGITNIDLSEIFRHAQRPRDFFLQHIVNLKAQQSFARNDNDIKAAEQIETWFETLEHQLKILFEDPKLELVFERKSYNFTIKLENKPPFDFNQMSDGYAAVFSIIAELILRMEFYESMVYDLPGIVLIDEIETHLHVDLQKQILPFLTSFFPNIQFIVTTHSPFVITSLRNAVVCDLEKKIVVSDLSAYSYDAIIESYYNSDKYSSELKSNVTRYEYLLSNVAMLSNEEYGEVLELSKYFDGVPKHLAPELQLKLKQLRSTYQK